MGDIKYTYSQSHGKVKLIEPDSETKKLVEEFHDYMQSIEGQAVCIIYEKYRREYSIDLSILKNLILYFSEERKKKKNPNVDYLAQKLSEFVKNHCPKYE